jgi:hypothetical protein
MNKSDKKIDSDFLWNVAKEGIIIWGLPELKVFTTQSKDMKPRALFNYNLSGLIAREKKAVRRAFFGYRTVKKTPRKSYINSKEGLLSEKNQLGPNVLYVPLQKVEEVIIVFDRYNVKYRMKKIWE